MVIRRFCILGVFLYDNTGNKFTQMAEIDFEYCALLLLLQVAINELSIECCASQADMSRTAHLQLMISRLATCSGQATMETLVIFSDFSD